MPTHISDLSSLNISGILDVENHGPNATTSTLFLPVVTTFPVPTYANGQIAFCPASGGALGITQSGAWKIIGATGVSGLYPDDVLVSGALLFWGHPSGFQVESAGSSGIQFWNNRSVYSTTYKPSGTSNRPTIISGVGWNGLDRAYLAISGHQHFNENNFITPFNVTDQSFTIFVVGEVQSTGVGNYSAFCCANSASLINFTQVFVGGTGNCAMGARKLDNASADTNHINTRQGALDNSKHIWVWLCSGISIRMFRDNEELTAGASGYNLGAMSSNNGRIGAVERSDGLLSEWNGYMDEIAIYAASGLSTRQIDWITQNLAARHNVRITSGTYING